MSTAVGFVYECFENLIKLMIIVSEYMPSSINGVHSIMLVVPSCVSRLVVLHFQFFSSFPPLCRCIMSTSVVVINIASYWSIVPLLHLDRVSLLIYLSFGFSSYEFHEVVKLSGNYSI